MINPTGKKLEKLLFGMFDDAIKGVDRYNHNGSLWLIFTDEMRWVVEYTKAQTLWYNYHSFKQEMEMVGLDCVDNKDLIQKWFESRFLNIPKVQDTLHALRRNHNIVEHTIQNGVKQTELSKRDFFPEDIFQNGVKHIENLPTNNPTRIEDTIQNGVKETCESESTRSISLRLAIQNGVKHCEDGDWLDGDERFEDIIQNGVKEMQPLPAQDGNRDWGKYYHGKEDRTKPHTEYVKDVIKIGEKLN